MTAIYATQLAGSIVRSGYVSLVLQRLVRQASTLLAAEESWILVRDRVRPDESILAAADGDGVRPLVGRRLVHAGDELRDRPGLTVAALASGGEVHGELGVRVGDPNRTLDARELRVLAALADVADAAIHHANARSELLPDVRERTRALAGELDRNDGYTASHSEAIAALACRLGERLGLPAAALAELEVAALLHDIGKVRVPAAVLRKPGPLDEREQIALDRHPDDGADLVAGIPGLEVAATIVRYHHERWDGGGYPHRLAGERIPVASRIIAVCDAFHAMTSTRPYRAALPVDAALDVLRREAGAQFDAGVVLELTRHADDLIVDPDRGRSAA
jgi:HD-GYP domain-containing protein (c-di-GMP phosphodiesterase class II)